VAVIAASAAPRMKLSRAQAPPLLLVLAVAVLAWRSIVLTTEQAHALVLPGAVLLAPISVAAILLVNRSPGRGKLPFDDETDVIVAFTFAVLGGWFLYWTPHRFGSDYWLWRPDLLAIALCAAAVATITTGSGVILYVGLPLVAATIVSCPLLGLLVHDVNSGIVVVAVVSALAAVLPLLLAQPHVLREKLRQGGLALAAGVLAAVVGKVTKISSVDVSFVAAGLAFVAVEAMILRAAPEPRARGAHGAPLVTWRLLTVVVLVVGFALLDGAIPTFSSVSTSSVKSLLTPTSEPLGQLDAPGGLTTTAWGVKSSGESHDLASEVYTSTAPTKAAVLTYPVESLIKWLGAPCPNQRHETIDGITVKSSQYTNSQAGTNWNIYTWNWHNSDGYQRVSLIMAYGLQGNVAELPVLTRSALSNGISTVGLFVANRHIVCFNSPARLASGNDLVSQLIAEGRR
jgi:hypothetical protein